MNGRYGGDHDIGKPTCKNSSTVDYIIISENLSKIISDFDILEFDRTLSDIHCPIYASYPIEKKNIVQAEQAGFKSDFSTIDHVFVLKSLADIYLSKRQRLYCCFVDYKSI